MKNLLGSLLLLLTLHTSAQDQNISTIDFVQIANGNRDEAIFYYKNNWLKLRQKAVERDFIVSYELISVDATPEAPFDLILMTTYPNKDAFEKAEENFGILIEEQGELKLLNDKKPGDFRKILFSKMDGKHL
ncbi:hypothetical protein [Ekhidna sp.]|uniref:hypothetical protein n=1 Tax=Ekhidna sp. TaxID=2608089 RepID=UPI0035144CFA